MPAGFRHLPMVLATNDLVTGILLRALEYEDSQGGVWRARVGTRTDGPSMPYLVRAKFGQDVVERAGPPGVLHDAGYHGTLERRGASGLWERATLDKAGCDRLFRDALISRQIEPLIVEEIYLAVVVAGGKAWKTGRESVSQ